LRSQPFAHVVLQKHSAGVCDWCLRSTNSLQRCSSCKVTRYCDTKCQRLAWTLHKEECSYLKRVAPKVPPDTVRLLARIIFKLKAGGARQIATLPDGSKRAFDDLMTHDKKVLHDEERMEAFNAYFEVLKDCLNIQDIIPKPDLFEIYCKVLINSFNVMDDDYQPVGIALYLGPSVLDHSCRPNATVVFVGKTIMVRSVEAIPSFREVRISYTNLVGPRDKRRKELADQYYFECQCTECQLTADGSLHRENLKLGSVVCPGCQRSVSTAKKTEDPLRCDQIQCNGRDLSEKAKKHSELTKELTEKVFANRTGHPDPMDMCNDFFQDMVGLFSPCDANFLQVLEYLYESRVSEGKWREAYTAARLTVESYRLLYPKFDVNTCSMLMKAGKLASYLVLDDEAEGHLTEAKTLLRVTYGPNHPLYTDVLPPLIQAVKFAKQQNAADHASNVAKLPVKSAAKYG